MAEFGIKISSGVDIIKAQEKDIIFSSTRNMLKTDAIGIAGSTNFSHGLNYCPIFFTNGGGIIGGDATSNCDSNNFSPLSGVRWYLFFQQAN
jgi:hypothetical protein